jgi:hypothetical protein
MKLSFALLLGGLIVLLASTLSLACWKGRDPVQFGRACPVIVTGTIVDIETPDMLPPRGEDTAVITIHKVHKNIVADQPLRVGSVVRAKMHSFKNQLRVSTDLRYPMGTKAIWLLDFGKDGAWHINLHPVQQQPVEKEQELQQKGAFGSAELISERKVGDQIIAGRTRAELFARWQRRLRGEKELPEGKKDASGKESTAK